MADDQSDLEARGGTDPEDIIEAVSDAEDETAAVETLTGRLEVENRSELVAALERWDGAARDALVEATEWWHDEREFLEAVARWDERHPEVDPDRFVALDPETAHPTQLEVIRDLKTYFADSDAGPFDGTPDQEFLETKFFDFSYLEDAIEVEHYWVNEPFTLVTVLWSPRRREYEYHVVEPELDEFERYVRQDLVTLLRNSLMYQDVTDEDRDREEVFAERSRELIQKHAATVDVGSLQKVYYYLTRDFLRYGPIDAMMRDSGIEDISCDGAGAHIFIYSRKYRNLRTNVVMDERRLNSFVVQLAQRAGKQLSISEPLVDASLPDGSRIQLTLGGEVSTRGSNFTIRKFADIPLTPVDLVAWNTFSVEQMAYYWLAIENNKSLIFAGGTGSGKTTSMNAVSFFIPPGSKLVSIEDTREIDLPHDNWIQSVSRRGVGEAGRGEISMYDLLQAALRQRPEYLIVGEIRTEQRVALTFFQAMSTGHTAYTTLHADSVETVLSRLQNPPLSVPTQMLQELDIVSIQRQSYIGDNRVRRNRAVWELSASEEAGVDEILTNQVFEWNPDDDVHEQVGDSHVLAEVARERGWDEAELAQQLEERERVLEYLVENDIRDFQTVANTIYMFAKDRAFVLDLVESDELRPGSFDLDVDLEPAEHLDQREEILAASEGAPDLAAPVDDRTLADLEDRFEPAEDPTSTGAESEERR